MSGVFRKIDPLPPRRPASVYPLPLVRGEDTLAGWRGRGGSIVWNREKTYTYIEHWAGKAARLASWRKMTQQGEIC
jgi:hypothetical protein